MRSRQGSKDEVEHLQEGAHRSIGGFDKNEGGN
jgi:hypothetical protein